MSPTAKWHIAAAAHNTPQAWKDKPLSPDNTASGVRLIHPNDSYAKTARSVKYAILFISLTFAVFFLLETIQKKRIHPVQYTLVGAALCVFYTLLLSVSEYTGFDIAYMIAASATTLLIGFYVSSMFKSNRTGLIFTGALATLYAYIFMLIQLQDYALLFGSIGLFLILAIFMYVSRHTSWYQDRQNTPDPGSVSTNTSGR